MVQTRDDNYLIKMFFYTSLESVNYLQICFFLSYNFFGKTMYIEINGLKGVDREQLLLYIYCG